MVVAVVLRLSYPSYNETLVLSLQWYLHAHPGVTRQTLVPLHHPPGGEKKDSFLPATLASIVWKSTLFSQRDLVFQADMPLCELPEMQTVPSTW